MAKLVSPGGFTAAESEYPIPETGLTKLTVRELLGPPVVAYPAVRGGYVFVRYPHPDVVGILKPNLRASTLCGILVFGPALYVGAAEKVEWYDPPNASENKA